MKDLFPGYYRPTQEEFDDLWKKATFVFDANVLLHIHRRNKQVRRAILDKFKQLGDRLWIPYEIVAEYQRNKLTVVSGLVNDCKTILEGLKKVREPLREHKFREHPVLDAEALKTGLDQLIQQVELAREASTRVPMDDAESSELAAILQGRIDAPYAQDVRSTMLKKAKARAEENIPPGFEDYKTKKNEALAGGDALIWFKMLDRAREKQCPIIFVTEDAKKDWWGEDEQTQGPHPELRQEMWRDARQPFYMYRLSAFLEHAGRYLGETVPADVVKNVKAHEQEQKDVANSRLSDSMGLIEHRDAIEEMLTQRRGQRAALRDMIESIAAQPVDPNSPGGQFQEKRIDVLTSRLVEIQADIERLSRAAVELDTKILFEPEFLTE